ncbi:hypothetical protein K2173_005869 [Erythroxylum novogranatense]|uniref:Annexin n=1 Tax=Erythroxylum novogranatense TaxID=1862640 RepID=A0AAV8U352_9ROSI|nr:hypothetical protein K2173_005869 [Erythroxylum novogranatense]
MSTLNIPSKISPRDDALQIHRAFKGLGCDTDVIVNILGHRDASQRDDIQQEYETMFSDELRKRLSSELHGHLKKAVLLWMKSPVERDVSAIKRALKGAIIDLKAATEIICSRTSSQIRQIKQAYTSTYGNRLENDVDEYTSGNHKKLLLAYLSTTRYEGPEIDTVLVEDDAKTIRKAGQKHSGVDERTFIHIFSERSRAHLVALDSTYRQMFGLNLRRAIKKEASGNFKYGLLTILHCAYNPAQFYAVVLRKAMKGLGTKDTTLIRVIVTRAEFDMQLVMAEFHKKYRKTLADAVHSETSGQYRVFLLSLLGST